MFPETLMIQSSPYTLATSSMSGYTRLYKRLRDTVVCKYARLDSGEIYYHRRHRCDTTIVVTPATILYRDDHAIIVYPYMGLDAATLARSDFWSLYEHVTLSTMETLISSLYTFHAQSQMAMGDIKPENIVYNTATGAVRYIDLEYATGPHVVQVPSERSFQLRIVVPNPRTRYYRTVTTPAYESFDKRCSMDYCVFRNDRYALATTLFCLLTNQEAPGTYMFPRTLSATRDRSEWDRLHALAYNQLLSHVQDTVRWNIVNTETVVSFIRVQWMDSRLPPFAA